MRYLFLVLAILVFAVPIIAQEEIECDLTELDSMLATAREAISSGDAATIDETLIELQGVLSSTRANCAGLSFSSETDGRQPVLGPLTLEDGMYRVNLDTPGFFIAQVETLAGECDAGLGGVLFSAFEGQGEKASAILESNGCEMLLAISNVTEDWTLSFEKIR